MEKLLLLKENKARRMLKHRLYCGTHMQHNVDFLQTVPNYQNHIIILVDRDYVYI